MLSAIVDGFKWLIDFFETIFEVITNFISSLLNLFGYISSATSLAYNLISTMPTWVSGFALITVSVLVLYMILGRRAGG